MFSPKRQTALLVDFDNVARLGAGLVNRIPDWIRWIEDGGFDPDGGKRKLISKKVYWNSHNDLHRVPFERAGFEVEVCIARRKEKASSADFELTIDALDLAYQRKGLKEVIILSLDTDFLSILHRLQEMDIEVVAMVSEDSRTAVYRDRANNVISDARLKAAFDYPAPTRTWFGLRTVPPRMAAPSASPAPNAPKPARAPAKASVAPAAKRAPPKFDLLAAAQRVARAGAQTPGKPLSKSVVTALLRDVEGFSVTPPHAYFGLGSYPAMTAQFARLLPELRVERFQPGGFLAITYRGTETSGQGAPQPA